MNRWLLTPLSIIATMTIAANWAPLDNKNATNFSLYWAWEKSKSWSFNGLGVLFESKEYHLSAEATKNLKKVSVSYIQKVGEDLFIKWGSWYLLKDFHYKWEKYRARELKLGIALLFSDYNSYTLEAGQIVSILNGLGHADTTSSISYINWIYKKSKFDTSFELSDYYVYQKHHIKASTSVGYYPSEDMRVWVNYNSLNQRRGNYAIRGGLTYTFGWNISPYFNAAYNISNHITATAEFKTNRANQPLYFEDALNAILNKSEITALQYDSKGFYKKLDQNIEDRNKAPIAKDDIATVQEWKIYAINVLANDIDPEGKTLNITGISESNWEFSVVWDNINFNAKTPWIYSCKYTISDGSKTDTAKLTVTVTEKPKPAPKPKPKPKPTPETPPKIWTLTNQVLNNGESLDYTIPITETDWDKATVTVTGLPSGFTFDAWTNKITWSSTTAWISTITVKATDNDGSVTKTFTIEVKEAVNTAPVINQTTFDWWFARSARFPNVVSDDWGLSNITMTASPTKWTLAYNGDWSITYTRTDTNSWWSDVFNVTFSDWTKETTSLMTFTWFDDE